MKANYYISFSALFLFLLQQNCAAQNIRGDTIYVNANTKVAVVFPAVPNRAEFYVKDGSYEVDELGKTSLSVKAAKRGVKDQALEVSEGKRKHLFVLSYKEELPVLRIDWSSLKKLRAHVEERKKATAKALAEANHLFDQQLWEQAQARYRQLVYAVDVKDTGLVRSRLGKIQDQLQAIAERKYKDVMALGITYGTAGKYAEAERAFTEALTYKSNDEQALKNIKFNKQKWFEDCVKKGDGANAAKDYVTAKAWYQQAMAMKPDDRVVPDKYNEAKKKADPKIYQIMKAKGDSTYEVNDLVLARKSYDSALVVKPKDKYVEDQLKKIDKLEEYNSIVDKANNLAATATTVQQYDLAINEYRRALVVFPNRDYPKDQIKDLVIKRDGMANKLTNVKNR